MPSALKSVIVVIGRLGKVIVEVPGLPACSLHIPRPTAEVIAIASSNIGTQFKTMSIPALENEVIFMATVSLHPLELVQIKW